MHLKLLVSSQTINYLDFFKRMLNYRNLRLQNMLEILKYV